VQYGQSKWSQFVMTQSIKILGILEHVRSNRKTDINQSVWHVRLVPEVIVRSDTLNRVQLRVSLPVWGLRGAAAVSNVDLFWCGESLRL
jgi:hypothetical protein